MRTITMVMVSALVVALASPAVAQGQKKGFDEETQTTLGNSGNPTKFEGQGGEGTTTTTTTGPRGQVKQEGECDHQNCTTETTDRPGRNR